MNSGVEADSQRYADSLSDDAREFFSQEIIPCDPDTLARMKQVIMKEISRTPQLKREV